MIWLMIAIACYMLLIFVGMLLLLGRRNND